MAGLSIVHGTLPPHPAAMLAATQYHADLGRTILWGLIVGIPAGICAGPVLGWFLTRRWYKKAAQVGFQAAEEGSSVFEIPHPSKRHSKPPRLRLPPMSNRFPHPPRPFALPPPFSCRLRSSFSEVGLIPSLLPEP